MRSTFFSTWKLKSKLKPTFKELANKDRLMNVVILANVLITVIFVARPLLSEEMYALTRLFINK